MDSEQIGGLITQPLRLEQWQVKIGGNIMWYLIISLLLQLREYYKDFLHTLEIKLCGLGSRIEDIEAE